jgi:hypothetical protein
MLGEVEGGATDGNSDEMLLSFLLRASLAPVEWGEHEDARGGARLTLLLATRR